MTCSRWVSLVAVCFALGQWGLGERAGNGVWLKPLLRGRDGGTVTSRWPAGRGGWRDA